MNNVDNTKPIYKLGKSFRVIGSWLIWGTISSLIFMFISITFWSSNLENTFVSVLSAISMLIFLGASLFFITLLGINTIKMIVRGYKTAFALKIRRYKTFSKLNLISLITSSIMYILIIIVVTMTGIFGGDPVYGFFDSILYLFGNVFLIPIYLGSIAGSILRMIAWYQLKTALIMTSDDSNIEKAASRTTLMFATQIFLGVSSPLLIISMTISTGLFLAVLIVPYVAFYIIKIWCYRSIGKNIMEYYDSTFEPEKVIRSKKPRKSMQVPSINVQNVEIDCPECGFSNSKINKYCLFCGNDLN